MPSCDIHVPSEEFADFIVRYNNAPRESVYEMTGSNCIDFVNNDFAVAYVPLEEVEPISIERQSYGAIPKLYGLLDTTSMEASGITQTFAQPNLNLRGEGVLIGIIDTGIDYQNPLFKNQDGTTRILSLWDQTLPRVDSGIGSAFPLSEAWPEFLYGQSFHEDEINLALASDSPFDIVPSTDTLGHGTFLAGIAAGGESQNQDFIGAAPSAYLSIVKLKPAKRYLRDFFAIREDATAYQENDIMTGIRYLTNTAALYSIPLVILIGLGTNSGSHDGTSPLCMVLQSISINTGVVPVIAAGNETGYHHHFLGRIGQEEEFEDVEIRVPTGERGFVVELWAREPDLYTVGFISPTGEQISNIPNIQGNETRITFLLEQTVITVNYKLAEGGSGSQLIFIRFLNPTAGVWRIRVYNSLFIVGQYHMWLPIRGFISDDTIFLQSNPDTTITDPGNAPSPVTVAAYNHQNNSIYIHSSRGYTRADKIKPDLAAPGVDVYGPGTTLSSNGRILPGDQPQSTPMTRKTGTSVAAAHVAGAVASLLAWGVRTGWLVTITSPGIKSYLIRGAQRNPAYTYPNGKGRFLQLSL